MIFKKKLKLLSVGLYAIIVSQGAIAQQKSVWQFKPGAIATRWAHQVSPNKVLPEYPRPQLVRNHWINLNGLWEYAVTSKSSTAPTTYTGSILVPYPVESALSGVKKSLKPTELLWYHRSISTPPTRNGERVLLHFGAVDFEATIYVNGQQLATHTGGYQHFTVDVTDAMKTGNNELIVRVWDPTDAGPNPHGKQVLDPIGIMYTPSSGIWQTVWMEVVPHDYVKALKITPNIDQQTIAVEVAIGNGEAPFSEELDKFNGPQDGSDYSINVEIRTKDKVVTRAMAPVGQALIARLPNPRLWSPDDPFLYDLKLQLVKNGKIVEEIGSYFGMRKIAIEKDGKGIDRIFLNNKYTFNLGTLDQGFWPDGLYTAPTDAALKFDIEAAKAMGFNTIRKHIKIEPDRWYFHADKLGMLVWQDMVNPGNNTKQARDQFEKENQINIAQLYNHPSIITWVLFNEKWGQYDQERLTKWMKSYDPTRLVNGHSGEILYVNDELRSPSPNAWVAADMTDVHSYPFPRNAPYQPGKAMVLGEFGGIGVPVEGHLWDDLVAGWGYDGVVTPPMMQLQYSSMADSLKILEKLGLSASIYTQPFDVESEQNGLMTYDREIIKLPVSTLRIIHSKLWPITGNYAVATRNFTATVADTVNKDYATRLAEYKAGKDDSTFLRSLTTLAVKFNDTANITKFSNAFIKQLKNPYLEHNLKFIARFTNKKTDPGYPILQKGVVLLGYHNSPRTITGKMERIIFDDEIKGILNENPDWDKVEEIIRTHMPLEGEMIRGLCVVKYLNAATHGKTNGTKNLVAAATRYDDRYHSGNYNAWAWLLFEKTQDRKELEKAIEWSQKAINQETTDPARKAGSLDTYANLLYKLGRTKEAIEWQEKAVAVSGGDLQIKDNFEKMKRGEPTWPQVN